MDMAVSGTWVYVGYSCSSQTQVILAKMRRFALDTGNLDVGYTSGGHEVANTSPATVGDLAVETSIDTYSLFLSRVDQAGDIQVWRYHGFEDGTLDAWSATQE